MISTGKLQEQQQCGARGKGRQLAGLYWSFVRKVGSQPSWCGHVQSEAQKMCPKAAKYRPVGTQQPEVTAQTIRARGPAETHYKLSGSVIKNSDFGIRLI